MIAIDFLDFLHDSLNFMGGVISGIGIRNLSDFIIFVSRYLYPVGRRRINPLWRLIKCLLGRLKKFLFKLLGSSFVAYLIAGRNLIGM